MSSGNTCPSSLASCHVLLRLGDLHSNTVIVGAPCTLREVRGMVRVSREEQFLHRGQHSFAHCENRVCNLGRMSSTEFEDSVTVKAKVGLPYRWWNAVIHIATLILAIMAMLFCIGASKERAEQYHTVAKSSWLFDGSWAWLFFFGSFSASNQEQRAREVSYHRL